MEEDTGVSEELLSGEVDEPGSGAIEDERPVGNKDTLLQKRKRKPRRRRKNANVRTLFVGGLPMDVKSREIYLMCRKFEGYQGSILKMYGKEGKTASPVAFVTFENREQAEAAKKELHGVKFDETTPRLLKIEFAKTNTKDASKAISVKTLKARDDHRVIHPPTVPLDDYALQPQAAPVEPVVPTWPTPGMFYDVNGNFIPSYFPPPPPPAPLAQPPQPAPPQLKPTFVPNPELEGSGTFEQPCTTLFVANLGHNAKEDELKHLFSTIPSFVQLKMHHNKGLKPVCFVQYGDIASATQAKTLFSERILFSAETGGLRIEYAKKDMGELW